MTAVHQTVSCLHALPLLSWLDAPADTSFGRLLKNKAYLFNIMRRKQTKVKSQQSLGIKPRTPDTSPRLPLPALAFPHLPSPFLSFPFLAFLCLPSTFPFRGLFSFIGWLDFHDTLFTCVLAMMFVLLFTRLMLMCTKLLQLFIDHSNTCFPLSLLPFLLPSTLPSSLPFSLPPFLSPFYPPFVPFLRRCQCLSGCHSVVAIPTQCSISGNRCPNYRATRRQPAICQPAAQQRRGQPTISTTQHTFTKFATLGCTSLVASFPGLPHFLFFSLYSVYTKSAQERATRVTPIEAHSQGEIIEPY